LPTGMQVVGNLYEDRTTLAFAEMLQAEGLSA
jgi:amidase